jgi:Site-specific recombinase XerD
MTIKKTPSGWLVDIQPGGRGAKRYRKTLPTKAEALAYEAWLTNKVNQAPEWLPPKRDLRRLSELVDLWQQHHGVNLRSSNTYSRLKRLCEALGDPVADKFGAELFAEYRARRLEAGISASNLNREHAYLRAVFNELGRLGHWKGENPLSKVRQFKVPDRELSYLTLEQIGTLLAALEGDAHLVAKVCLSTGARWSEAEGLRVSQVRDGLVHFSGTKSGKNRSVPIAEELEAELKEAITKSRTGRLFKYAYSAFRDGVARAGLQLPRGQLTHVLRHTFASHFMMNGGNILVLQKLLGHSSLTMTMRYAHLAPDHLQEARTLNPLARLRPCNANVIVGRNT